VPDDKMVVLGLVNTKLPTREEQKDLLARIREASEFVPAERLAISPQCGFSTSIVGNRISVDDQKSKLRLVVDTATSFWG
jgi:5-methyltetrahydropteroyltriglutamate--homocysteine methyltransferase